MDIASYNVEISRHAFLRANERGITPDILFATINGGRIEKFGKCFVRISKEYKKFNVICIGKISLDNIKILTVECNKL
ncbi:MAG: hypothetical protein ACP5N2_01800 [Candidatus Nanoarchaeia archaeon]